MCCSKRVYSTLMGTASLLVATAMGVSQCSAAIIAQEDFESYSIGDDVATSGGSGGTGWTGNWSETGSGGSLADAMSVEDGLFAGYGQGLEIINRSSSSNNILVRQFPVQTGDIYIGMSMNHSVPFNGDDFLHFYFNDSTGSTSNAGVGGGVFRGSDQVGNYKVRIGGNGSDSLQANSSTYGADQTFVFKLSKSAGTDYDQVSLWANQTTEGTPDASLGAGAGNALALTQISTFHLRWTPLFPSSDPSSAMGTLNLDNLVIATTFDEALTLVNNPVPEPSTLLLVGLGLATVAIARRRS